MGSIISSYIFPLLLLFCNIDQSSYIIYSLCLYKNKNHLFLKMKGDSFYTKEIHYLKDNGYGFVDEEGIWHAIR